MIEIIPAVLVDSVEELVRQVHILERAGVKRAHLDICDGSFVETRTIDGYTELHRLVSDMRWDIHLMVNQPEEHIVNWKACCDEVDRFIVHVEATDKLSELAERVHAQGNHLWGAINPETSRDRLPGADVDGVTFMTVHPGKQGSPFLADVVPGIAAFHAAHPTMPIMVDGGITPSTARQCAVAGASILVSGSHIIRAENVAHAIEELTSVVE